MPVEFQGRYLFQHDFPKSKLRETTSRRTFLAQDVVIGRKVVLKSDRIGEHKETQHEVAILGRLASPNIVYVFDTFEEGGRYYAVIEYHHHETMEHLLCNQQGRLNADRAIPIVQNLLRAFSDMHNTGIIHRDLHPGHISYRNRADIKLFDLGLAVNCQQQLTCLECVNPHSEGTWETMAPEEFKVDGKLTPATNIYSAATLLYRLIDGK